MLIGISPVRISFAGGGTDLPEFYEKYSEFNRGGNFNRVCISNALTDN